MRMTLVCLIASLAGLGPGCTDARTEDLATERMLFSRLGHYEYSFTWQQDCFCAIEMARPIRITVEEGEITNAVYADDRQPVTELARRGLRTIPGVFDMIQDMIDRDPDELTITYDPEVHYPASVVADFEARASDDETALHLSDFMATPRPL